MAKLFDIELALPIFDDDRLQCANEKCGCRQRGWLRALLSSVSYALSRFVHISQTKIVVVTMKLSIAITALLASSAAAFAPATSQVRVIKSRTVAV